MNKVVLMGRLTRDPEIRYSTNANGEQTAVARYTLAVDRRYGRSGETQSDFIGCVTFGKAAEFAQKSFVQGMMLTVSGRIQTGSYTNKDGQKVYTTDVVVDDQEFAESKAVNDSRREAKQKPAQQAPQGYAPAPQQYSQPQPMPQQYGQQAMPPHGYGQAAQPMPQQTYNAPAQMPQQTYTQTAPQGYAPQQQYGQPVPQQYGQPAPEGNNFMNIPDGIDEELPFN